MKKILIATVVTLMCGSAFAQNSTGPAPQSDNMNKPGMSGSMDKGAMDKGSMSKNSTTGMNDKGMAKENMKKDMSKDNMKK